MKNPIYILSQNELIFIVPNKNQSSSYIPYKAIEIKTQKYSKVKKEIETQKLTNYVGGSSGH